MLRYLAVPLVSVAVVGCSSSSSPSKPANTLVPAVTVAAKATASPSPSPSPTPMPTPSSYHLVGSIQAPACGGGYRILNASVVIKNESGIVIGSGTTTDPADPAQQRVNQDIQRLESDGYKGSFAKPCVAEFALDVGGAQFYQITVGTHGAPTYSFAQMQQMGWRLQLSLGQ